MKNILFLFLSAITFPLFAQDTFQLAPPLLKYSSVFFTDKTNLEIKFAQAGAVVHYSLNNTEPTVINKVYTKPVTIKNNFTTVKAKAFGNNFLCSETAVVTFIKDGKPVQSINQTPPNVKYPGSGVNTLIDNKGGIEQYNSNTWMGYNCDTVAMTLYLVKQEMINKVLLNYLQDEKSWIFLPEKISISWFDKRSNSLKQFGEEEILNEKETPSVRCNHRIIRSKNKIKTDRILIHIIVKKYIPTWHAAKGEHTWMFIDEIKVY